MAHSRDYVNSMSAQGLNVLRKPCKFCSEFHNFKDYLKLTYINYLFLVNDLNTRLSSTGYKFIQIDTKEAIDL